MWYYYTFDEQRVFFFIWVFFHEHSQYTEQQGKGEAVSNFSLPSLPASQTLKH